MSFPLFTRLAFAFALFPVAALAHGPSIGSHGGQVQDAGPFQIELVIKTGDLTAYILDDKTGKPVDTKGGSAKVTVLAHKKQEIVELTPVDGGALHGTGMFEAADDLKAVVALNLPGKPPQQARFSTPH